MKNPIKKEEKKHLSVHVGYASRAADPGSRELPEVCGDTAVSCRLPDGSRAVILSDGMGHGGSAAEESRTAAGLLRRFLKQGVPAARAMKEVNRYLLERNRRKADGESFATVDLVIIDQISGRARFYKMGAAPSYIIRGRRIRKIQQPALPVGILPGIHLTHVSARLAPGDIIVMVSDGICDSGRRRAEESGAVEEDWIISFLNDGKMVMGPRQLAGALLAEADRRWGTDESDDATAAVAVIR